MKYERHPLSAAYPAMTAERYQSLLDSINSIGVQNPITLYEGMVIDGWHRYTAANELGMDCPTVEMSDCDPVEFVRAQNEFRRDDVTASQHAMIVVTLYAWKPRGRETQMGTGAHLAKSNAELAKIAGVGVRTIKQAKAAQKAGLTDAVKDGALSVKQAEKIFTGKTDKPQKATKPTPTVAETPKKEDEYTDLDAARDQVRELQSMLALANLGNVSDEDRTQAAELIKELRAENGVLRASLKAVTQSRDTLMNEMAQVKRQCLSQQREIKAMRVAA